LNLIVESVRSVPVVIIQGAIISPAHTGSQVSLAASVRPQVPIVTDAFV